MKIFYAWSVVALVGLAAGSVTARAQPATQKPSLLWCQNCTSLQQQTLALGQHVGSTVYIGNLGPNTVVAYEITSTGGGGIVYKPNSMRTMNANQRAKVAEAIAPDPNIVDAIDAAMAFHDAAPVGWHKNISARVDNKLFGDSTYPGSAYDIVNYGKAQNDFLDSLDAVYSPTFGAVTFSDVLQGLSALHVLDSSAVPLVTVTLNFSDGSRVTLHIDQKSGKAQLDPDTARDSDNNSIPYIGKDGRLHGVGGEHEFDPSTSNKQNLNNFLNWLAGRGIPIYSDQHAGTWHGTSCESETDSKGNVIIWCQTE